MARTISLKWDATCKDCGAELKAGTPARYYGKGRVYGTTCHEQKPSKGRPGPARTVVSTHCEDYPCCGHGPAPQGDGGGCPTVYSDGAETFRCASCRAEMPDNATSALCESCRNPKGTARTMEEWDDMRSDMDR
jgi:LSD1 subclass zinc finger protein